MQTPKAEPATKLQEQTECQLEIRPEKLAASTSSSASCDRSVFHLATLPHMRCFQVVAINTPTTLQLLFTAIQSNCLFFFLLLCFSRLPPSLFQTLFFIRFTFLFSSSYILQYKHHLSEGGGRKCQFGKPVGSFR